MFLKLGDKIVNSEHILAISKDKGIEIMLDTQQDIKAYRGADDETLDEVINVLYDALVSNEDITDEMIAQRLKIRKAG